MRIGVDARVLTQPELRGIANYLIELLNAWPDGNDEFILFYESGDIHASVQSPARITGVMVPEPPGTRFKVWHWLAMPNKLKKFSLDLFWSPANIPIPFINCKQILTIHDTLLQEKFRTHKLFDNIFYRILVPFCTRRFVHHVITVSHFSMERIHNIFNYDLNSIAVIHNGFPSAKISSQDRHEARANLEAMGIAAKRFAYALGASSSWKNTELLIRSFCIVAQTSSDLSLIVSGIQHSVMDKFSRLVDHLDIGSKVILLGFVDTYLRNTLYQAAELFVYPSLFEGFGFPPLEAMSAGCPVIASDRASIPEIVGDAALLVDCTSERDLANAILQVSNNMALQQRLIELGHANTLRFGWQQCTQAHRSIFEKISRQ